MSSNPRPRFAKTVAQRLDRRRFTAAAGAGLIAAPFLRLLRSEPALAAPGAAKRIIFVMTGGTNLDEWRMSGSSDQLLVTNSWNEGLDRVKDKLVVVENLDGGDGAHGSYHCLVTGDNYWRGPSMDRVIADHLSESGVVSSIPSLLLGSHVEDGKSYFRESGSVSTMDSPTSALALVFGGVDPSAQVDEAALAAALTRRQSMLDTVKDDLNELHSLLGPEERPKLEAHLDSLRQFEKRLTSDVPMGGGCAAPTLVDSSDPVEVARAQMQLAHATAACDISRVIGVQWGQHNQFNINLPDIDVVNDLHSLHHGPNKQDVLQRYENWFSHQFADFVELVADTPDPETGGSLLDTTLIAWVRGMGDAIGHSSSDSRLVFAGGPSILQTAATGRHIDAQGTNYKEGLACMGHALGITDAAQLGGHSPLGGVLA